MDDVRKKKLSKERLKRLELLKKRGDGGVLARDTRNGGSSDNS